MAAFVRHTKRLAALLCGALLALCLGAAPAVAQASEYEEGHILVGLQEGASAQQMRETFAALSWVNAQVFSSSATVESLGIMVVPLASGVTVEQAVEAAQDLPGVAFAEPDYLLELPDGEEGVVDDFPSLLALSQDMLGDAFPVNDPFLADDSLSYWHLQKTGAMSAWQRVPQGNKVTVAVLDSGCLLTHEDLVDNLLVDYAYDAYAAVYKVEPKPFKDLTGHGTHVAGIIAAVANNGLGTAGTGYQNVQVLPVNVFNPSTSKGSILSVVEGYGYLFGLLKSDPQLNIRVVNLSVGTTKMSEPIQALQKTIAEGLELGIFTVCAAGNNGNSTPVYPSDLPESFAVTSLSSNGMVPLNSSSYNSDKDLCAPGESIWSTLRDGTYNYKDGTSMAAPQVSAAAALLWSAYPGITLEQMRQILQESASALQEPVGREGMYGAGCLDVDAALTLVEGGGFVTVEPYAPGVYQIRLEPFDGVRQGVPTYWGDMFYWDEFQHCWLCLVTSAPQEISGNDLVFRTGREPVTISRPKTETPQAPAGDANGNGRMNIVDAQVAFDRACGHAAFAAADAAQWLTCDVNSDGALDASDALAIQYALHHGWDATSAQ